MLLNNCSHEHQGVKEDLVVAREQLFAALDRYAQLCSNIRNTHHRPSFLTSRFAGYPSSELSSELPYLPVLESRLQEATRNLNRAYELGRAKSSPPPIDKLPDEILAQVFHLIIAAEPRDLHPTGKYGAISFPSYPDPLAQTCARWRQIVLACSPLWPHIYLDYHPTHITPILDRARSYAQRAGDLPLELHITGLEGWPDLSPGPDAQIHQFLSSIAQRIKSIEIVRNSEIDSRYESGTLASILPGCSEMFTRLVIRSKGSPRPGFIAPVHLDEFWVPRAMDADLSLDQIERGFAHLTVLHASQVYPRWTSTAYQGLVDLRLASKHDYIYECPRIDCAEFIAILSASPRLQILHFGINLDFDPDSPMLNTTVRLNDLEVLSLTASRYCGPEDTEYEIQRILRHITPGSKPLSLALDLAGYHDPDPLATMEAFFSRSHIVKFCSKAGNPPPVTLLDHAPHLTELVFDHCIYDILYDFLPVRSQAGKLHSWVIRDSAIYMEDLELLIKQYPSRSTILSNCRLFGKDDGLVEIPADEIGGWESNYPLPVHVEYLTPGEPFDLPDWYNLN